MQRSSLLPNSAVECGENEFNEPQVEPVPIVVTVPPVPPERESWPLFLRDARLWEDGDWHC